MARIAPGVLIVLLASSVPAASAAPQPFGEAGSLAEASWRVSSVAERGRTIERYKLLGGGSESSIDGTTLSFVMIGSGRCTIRRHSTSCFGSGWGVLVRPRQVRIDPVMGTASVRFRFNSKSVEAFWQRRQPDLQHSPYPWIDPETDLPDPTRYTAVEVGISQPAVARGSIGSLRLAPSQIRGSMGWAELETSLVAGIVGDNAGHLLRWRWTFRT
jgi:hypothetical protein